MKVVRIRSGLPILRRATFCSFSLPLRPHLSRRLAIADFDLRGSLSLDDDDEVLAVLAEDRLSVGSLFLSAANAREPGSQCMSPGRSLGWQEMSISPLRCVFGCCPEWTISQSYLGRGFDFSSPGLFRGSPSGPTELRPLRHQHHVRQLWCPRRSGTMPTGALFNYDQVGLPFPRLPRQCPPPPPTPTA